MQYMSNNSYLQYSKIHDSLPTVIKHTPVSLPNAHKAQNNPVLTGDVNTWASTSDD